jgi:hypothetical protein
MTDFRTYVYWTAWFPYSTGKFITVITKARHRTSTWSSRIQSAPSIPIPPGSNISHPTTSRSFHWSLKFGPPNQNPINISPSPMRIRWKIQEMQFIIMQFSPRSNFPPFTYKYPPHTLTQHSQYPRPPFLKPYSGTQFTYTSPSCTYYKMRNWHHLYFVIISMNGK